MLLVYALTRASQHGWATATTAGLLSASAALIAGFIVVELRSPAPLLPLRIFKLRTLSGSNAAALFSGAAIFSQFFLLTLYMQQVLHYSALQTGAAYIAFTLAIIVFSGVSQAVVTRVGIRRVLPTGMFVATGSLLLYTRLPVNGHYFWDLFPAFLIGGIGMAFVFVPMSIGALAGVRQRDAGVASGLLNTSQQIGGAIGVAIATTIATTYTSRFATSHHVGVASGSALTHGFTIAFYALAGISLAGTILSALLVESQPAEAVEEEPVALLEAA
jgi:predicted MFS family arabinose efflux permease